MRLLRSLALVLAAVVQPAVAQDGARHVTPHDLVTLRSLGRLSVSPDGHSVVFGVVQTDLEENRYRTVWRLLEIGERTSREVADAGELVSSGRLGVITEFGPPPAPVWSPDNHWIAYLRRENGSTQLWRARRDRRGAEQLTHNSADVRAVVYARDGGKLLFETEPSQAQAEHALSEEGRSGFLFDERFFPSYARTPVFPDGARAPSTLALRLWAYDLAARRERPATPEEQAEFAELTTLPRPEGRAALRGRAVRARGGSLAWTEARDPARQGYAPPLTIVAQPIGARAPIVCAADECVMQRMAGLWWRNDRELLFLRQEGLRLQDRALYAWRPQESEAPRLLLRVPDLLGSPNPGCAVTEHKLICAYEQANYPPRLVAIDLNNGDVQTLYDPNPNFGQFQLGEPPQRIAIRAEGGADTYGYLVLPPNRTPNERLPLIIVTYRCDGFLRGGTGDEYPVYPFAAQGFAVLCYNSPDDLERQQVLDGEAYNAWQRGPGAGERHYVEETLTAALQTLDQASAIDLDRVGITGLSFGGEIVSFALPQVPRLAAAISSNSPGPGPGNYSLLAPRVRDMLRTWGVGAPDETPERWREFAFSPNVGRVRAPWLINAADREALSALEQVVAMEQAGRSVEMYVFPNEYHVKRQPAHRLAIYNRNIDWMNFWLRGVESGLTGDATQYERWRAMRENQCRLFGPNGTERHVRPRGHEELTDEELTPWYCRPGALARSRQ